MTLEALELASELSILRSLALKDDEIEGFFELFFTKIFTNVETV